MFAIRTAARTKTDALAAPLSRLRLCDINYFEPSFDFAPVPAFDCACSRGGMIVIAVA